MLYGLTGDTFCRMDAANAGHSSSRAALEGRPSLRETGERAGSETADGDYDWAAARPPRAASTSSGGRAVPDPLADALALNAAHRAHVQEAADLCCRFPDWGITWGMAGFSAVRGRKVLGPVSSTTALEALLGSTQ